MYQADNDLRRYFDNNPGRLLYKWLHYFEIYEHHFQRYRGKPVNILEIGVFHGGSLQLWRDYFGPQARIYGVDIDPRCKQFEEANTHILIGDQSDRTFLRQLKQEIPRPDILIDDGGHMMHQQIATFEELYPFIADDGIYLCEDLHTSYWPEWGGGLRRPGTFIEYAKQLVDSLNAYFIKTPVSFPVPITQSAHSLHFYDSMLVVEKQRRDSPPKDAKSGKAVFPEGSIGGIPKPLITFAVLTDDVKGGRRVENRVFSPGAASASRFKLAYGGWKEAGQFKYDDSVIHAAEAYLIHGQFPDKYSSDVLEHVFSSGKPVIHFFDESLPELASGERVTRSGFRRYLVECLKLAHLVVVESEAQKQAYLPLNSRITVLPQKLDAEIYAPVPASNGDRLEVVYLGGEGHLQNLLMIAEDLKKAADLYPGRIGFHFFGRGLAALGQHPSFHFYPAPALREDWKAEIQRIRPGLALLPLRENAGLELTNTLPLLEYAAWGIPVLASNVAPYREFVKNAETGLLAGNAANAWFDAINNCLGEPHKLSALATSARQWMGETHALSSDDSYLNSVFEQLLANAGPARPGKPPVDFMRLNEKTAYQKLLPSQRLLPRDIRWMENDLGSWQQPPHFHLLMTLLPDQAKWLPTTLDSLAAQINPSWRLSIIAFTPPPAGLDLEARVHWHEVGDDEDSYDALNHLACQGEADWVGFIEAGDLLPPQALFKLALHALRRSEWQVLYSDEDLLSADAHRSNPLYKPDYNPDLLHAYPYVGGLCLFQRNLYSALGGVNPEKDGLEVYDLILRCTERIPAASIGHVAEVLYSRFDQGGHSVRNWADIWRDSVQSVREHFARRNIAAEVEAGPYSGTHAVTYPLDRTPLVSILVPLHGKLEDLQSCIGSLLDKTDYPHYEVLLLRNGSQEAAVLEYLDQISHLADIRILDCPQPASFSAICNFGARHAKGDFLLLLQGNTEIMEGQWLSELMRHGLRPDVGVVGARLLNPNGTLHHAGIVTALDLASYPFGGLGSDQPGYMMRARFAQDYSAVSVACMLVRKDIYQSVGGMDELIFKENHSDVDLCLRVREAGSRVVYAPSATLTIKPAAGTDGTDGAQSRTEEKPAAEEDDDLLRRWAEKITYDPAYNRNLSLLSNKFEFEEDPALCWDPDWRPAPRVVAYPGDEHGCGEYRIMAPCRALNQAGLLQAQMSMKLYSPRELAKINPDVIVMQRQRAVTIEKAQKYSRAFCIYEADDLLHNLPPRSVHRDEIHGDELENVVEAVSRCDRLVTTTPTLADIYGRYCKDVKIVPNFLEKAKWGQLAPIRRQGRKPRVGWAGGDSHTGDLELLYPVIKALHGEVDWVFFGMFPESLRPYIHEHHRGVNIGLYPAKLASLGLDLALAPLEYHTFNEAKSPLKILEYGILGYPVICTDIVTYRGDYPVTRVSNKPQDWIEAIRLAISDRDALAAQGDKLRMHIQMNCMLEDNLDKWLEGWLP
jgi:GT2 family glycosyltransferase/glycosyltransferase involved in cell wall biosynthesis